MQQIPDNVQQDIIKLVPPSVVNEISCFAFFDNHPRDERNIDIVISTLRGEVKEYYQRELVCSVVIDCGFVASEIRILRNSKCELFYFLADSVKICIISAQGNLILHNVIEDVARYEIHDSACRGQACLKVIRKDDAVPLIFDDNFKSLGDESLLLDQFSACDAVPLMNDLMRKLIEIKYSMKCNERSYKELLNFRQTSAFTNYHMVNPNFIDTVYSTECKLEGALKIKTKKPWVKICNKKIVIVLEVLNKENVLLEDVHILLHRTAPTLVYTTKLYEPTLSPPHWVEIHSQKIYHNHEMAVVCVIGMEELKHDVRSKTEFYGVICYTFQGKEYLLPFENVIISATATMDEQFDVLSNIAEGNQRITILALLATTKKIDLCLRHIKNNTDLDLAVMDMFCKYLHMDKLDGITNVVVHRKSPYHTLYGVMVVLQRDHGNVGNCSSVSLHTRTPSQALALIHYIHDAVPHRVIATTSTQKITAKTDDLAHYNEEMSNKPPNQDIVARGKSILNQAEMTLEYLNRCSIKMRESKDDIVKMSMGMGQIDIFAGDVASFVEYRTKMLEEASKRIKGLIADSSDAGLEGMVTEDDYFA